MRAHEFKDLHERLLILYDFKHFTKLKEYLRVLTEAEKGNFLIYLKTNIWKGHTDKLIKYIKTFYTAENKRKFITWRYARAKTEAEKEEILKEKRKARYQNKKAKVI